MLIKPGYTGLFGAVSSEAGYSYVNAETRTLVGAMQTEPTNARKILIDALISGLKTDSLWTMLDVLWITAAHSTQAAKLNWKNPGLYPMIENGTGTFTTDRGYAGNGTDGYLYAEISPVLLTQGQQDSTTLAAWSRTIGQSANAPFGVRTGNSFFIRPRNASDLFAYRANQGTETSTANTDGTGFFAASRTGASATQGYRNGAALGAAGAVASSARNVNFISIGRHNSLYSTTEISVALAGAGMDATQNANLYSRINTYMTAIGAA